MIIKIYIKLIKATVALFLKVGNTGNNISKTISVILGHNAVYTLEQELLSKHNRKSIMLLTVNA